MNFSQVAYNLLTGQWKLDRQRAKEFAAQARSMKLYAGANPGINRPMAAPLSTPEDNRQAQERIRLIQGARQMEEDFQFFDGILGDFETYVVGDLRYMPDTGNTDANRAIQEYCAWKFDSIDNSNRLDLVKLARTAVRSYKRDGECGFIVLDDGYDIRLDAISGDRIGNPVMTTSTDPTNYNGIRVNANTGAPFQFDIFDRVFRTNAYVFKRSVPARDFLHYYEPFRFEQYHGVTVFKNSIEHAYDIKQILDFTKLNIKWRSSQLPYVQNEQGRPRGNGYDERGVGFGGVPEPLTIQTDGVTQTFLKLGEGVMEYPNDFPNSQFQSLMEELRRDCAVGCKLPLEFCYRSQSGGVVQRFYVNKAERTFDEEKRWLKRTILNPTKGRVIQKGIDTGELDLSKFGNLATNLARFRGTWQMGRAVSVDYGKETDADIKQIDAGLMSQKDYCAENGRDLESTLRETEEYTLAVFESAARIAQKVGQPIETVLPYISKKFPNPTTPAGNSAAEPSQTTADAQS